MTSFDTSQEDVAPERTSAESLTEFRTWVTRQVRRYGDGYVRQESHATGALARLRRGAGRGALDVPDIWPLTLAELPAGLTLPYSVPHRSPHEPSAYEAASHATLTLFAVHQRSLRRRVHVPGVRVGRALAGLAPRGGAPSPGVDSRVRALLSADDITEVERHLMGLITMLARTEQGLDYGQLAVDLVQLRGSELRRGVLHRWARDFYAPGPRTTADTPTEPADSVVGA